MIEKIIFENHMVLKEVKPMENGEGGVPQILFRAELPDRGAGFTTPQLLKAWKKEVLAAKDALKGAAAGARLFLAGPLASGMELFFADSIGRNARAVFRQIGQTQEFVHACGVELDPDVQAARTIVVPTDALSGIGRAL